jgi:hypothetical protein
MPLALDDRSRRDPVPFSVPPIGETDLDRIIKLIPSELVLFYAAAAPTISDVPWRYFGVVLFVVGTVLTPLILFFDGRSTTQRARWPQYVVRTLTFAACAMAIAWPFDAWLAHDEMRWVRSLAVLVIPFTGAFALRERRSEGVY